MMEWIKIISRYCPFNKPLKKIKMLTKVKMQDLSAADESINIRVDLSTLSNAEVDTLQSKKKGRHPTEQMEIFADFLYSMYHF